MPASTSLLFESVLWWWNGYTLLNGVHSACILCAIHTFSYICWIIRLKVHLFFNSFNGPSSSSTVPRVHLKQNSMLCNTSHMIFLMSLRVYVCVSNWSYTDKCVASITWKHIYADRTCLLRKQKALRQLINMWVSAKKWYENFNVRISAEKPFDMLCCHSRSLFSEMMYVSECWKCVKELNSAVGAEYLLLRLLYRCGIYKSTSSALCFQRKLIIIAGKKLSSLP